LENGKIAQVPKHLGDVGGSTEFIVLRANTDVALNDFLYLWAQERSTHSAAVALMVGTTGRQRVGGADIATLPVALPPLPEQRRIVAVMSFVDALIDAMRREAELLGVLLREAREWSFERLAPGPSIPISEAVQQVRRPVKVDAEEMYNQIGVRSFGRGIFTKEPVSGDALGNKKVFWVKPGDLVINIVFGWEGAVAVVPNTIENHCGSHRFPTYRRGDEGPIDYVRQFLLAKQGIEILGLSSPGGAGRNRTLNRSRLGSFQIPWPDIETQQNVANALGSVEAQIALAAAELAALRRVDRDLLRQQSRQQVRADAALDQFVERAA
jgi:type I restriction enzyme S subunit